MTVRRARILLASAILSPVVLFGAIAVIGESAPAVHVPTSAERTDATVRANNALAQNRCLINGGSTAVCSTMGGWTSLDVAGN